MECTGQQILPKTYLCCGEDSSITEVNALTDLLSRPMDTSPLNDTSSNSRDQLCALHTRSAKLKDSVLRRLWGGQLIFVECLLLC